MTGAFSESFASRKNWKLDEHLLQAIVETVPQGSTVLDIGAGIGRYVHALRDLGYDAIGVDGIENVRELSDNAVFQADLTKEPYWPDVFDWSICIEVGEHIPEEQSRHFWETLCSTSTEGLIVSWAVPGQRGRGHVACHLPEFVACRITRDDRWRLNETMTIEARRKAGGGWAGKLLVFTAT